MEYYSKIRERRLLQDEAEREGRVADSMAVRLDLMAQFHRGEKTLEEVQAELAAIKRNAKKAGKITRNQAFLGR